MKKFFSFLLALTVVGIGVFPSIALAECVDADGDGYYVCENEDDSRSPFAKGDEAPHCDHPVINEETEDYQLVIAPGVESVLGKDVHPGAIEAPNSKVDYDCNGKITGYLPEGVGGDGDLMDTIGNIIVIIGQIAVYVSAAALIYGGILWASASGEEMKIQKAKKTLIGAIIGLIVGLVAWNIVSFVTGTFG